MGDFSPDSPLASDAADDSDEDMIFSEERPLEGSIPKSNKRGGAGALPTFAMEDEEVQPEARKRLKVTPTVQRSKKGEVSTLVTKPSLSFFPHEVA